jgi:RNA polymerase sigma-70 factor (ECF subfamily)
MGIEHVIDTRCELRIGIMTPRQSGERHADVAEPALIKEDAKRSELVALVDRMAGGDERALAQFYDRTVGKAYGLALRIVSSKPLAEEIVADSFYQAWKQAGAYDSSRANPMTWLLVICRSRALDALRARDPASLHESPEELVREEDTPRDRDSFDLLAALETRHAIHAAVATLSPSQRQMIGLAFFRGLTHQEIAQSVGLPLGTVKSQIRRALEALKRKLPDVGEPGTTTCHHRDKQH